MLYFFTTLAIGHLPPLDWYCLLIDHACGQAFIPPSTVRFDPVMYEDSGPAMNATGGDLVNTPIAVERGGGLLGHCPIARCGIQIRVDRTRLDVVDRDAPAPDLSSQRLSEHLHGSLRARVGHKPGRRDTLAHGGTDHDYASAALHVLQRRLRRDEHATDVDVNHAIHLL